MKSKFLKIFNIKNTAFLIVVFVFLFFGLKVQAAACKKPTDPPPNWNGLPDDGCNITIEYTDPAGGGGLATCEYKVESKGFTTVDWTSAGTCSGEGPVYLTVSISIGPGENCRDSGVGACVVKARAIDVAGNTKEDSQSYKIDIGLPESIINSPLDDTWYDTTATIYFDVTDRDCPQTGICLAPGGGGWAYENGKRSTGKTEAVLASKEIPNSNLQVPNKFQIPNSNNQTFFGKIYQGFKENVLKFFSLLKESFKKIASFFKNLGDFLAKKVHVPIFATGPTSVNSPRIITASVEPRKVRPGDTMIVKAEIEDDYGIESVKVDMGGIETISLELKDGNLYQGTWQNNWNVHDTEVREYVTTITATNILGYSSQKEVKWTDDPAWLSGWSYRKAITIAGASGAGTNYQVKLLVGESSGATGVNFHVENHCTDFPNDIRFTHSDGTTLLSHWLEEVSGSSPNRKAIFWVKVTEDLGSSKDIYCYYGKSGEASASDGNATFLFFDDFNVDLSKWTVLSGTWTIQADGTVKANSASDVVAFMRSATYSVGDARVRAKARLETQDDTNIVFRITDADNFYIVYNSRYTDFQYLRQYKNVAGTWTQIGTQSAFNPGTTWHVYEERATGSSLKATVDDANEVSATDTAFTSGYVGLRFWKGGDAYVDWIFAAKYVDPEPTFSSAGSEETPVAPTVTLSAATNVTSSTATLNGDVTDTGGEDPTVTVYWGTTDGGQVPENWQNSSAPTSPSQPQGVAAFYKDVTGLDASTLYYFSAKATNSAGTSWPAASLSFTTSPPPNVPPDATSVSDSPDPVDIGEVVTFTGNWTEPDAGDSVKMYICRDSTCTNCNNTSQTDCWCYSSVWQIEPDTSDTCSYTAQSEDVGDNEYWLGVCDDQPSCDSTPLYGGTFTVLAPPENSGLDPNGCFFIVVDTVTGTINTIPRDCGSSPVLPGVDVSTYCPSQGANACSVTVFAMDNAGNVGTGETRSYNIGTGANQSPQAQVLTAITQGSHCCGVTGYPPVILSWQYSDADGDPQSACQVQIDNNSDFSSPEIDTGQVSSQSNSYAPTNLSWATTYYWRVKVWDSQGAQSDCGFSEGWCYPDPSTFTTISHPYPWVDFTWSPQYPTKDEVVQFCSVYEEVPCPPEEAPCPIICSADVSTCYTGIGPNPTSCSGGTFWWEIIPSGAGTFVDGTTSSSKNPRIKFISSNVKLSITDPSPEHYGPCDITKLVGVALPLPKWKEIKPF